jgi:hypothetical protein
VTISERGLMDGVRCAAPGERELLPRRCAGCTGVPPLIITHPRKQQLQHGGDISSVEHIDA